jgi:hypothetical protein
VRPFTATELSRMRGAQDDAMQDICKVWAYSSTPDTYGNPAPTFTWVGDLSVCGFRHVKPSEAHGSGEVPIMDAELRLPVGTIITSLDRVEVLQRYSEDLDTAEMYEIIGPVRRGPSGLVVSLRLATDE